MSILCNALTVVILAIGILYTAYKVYGGFLAKKVFGFDNARTTPAEEQEDGIDFVPTRPAILFGHHFASIAGLGPIVGPAIAIYWGWLPALIWVLVGCVLIGGVHDVAALFASIRHKARSIGDLTNDIISPRARILFQLIIFFLLALAMGVFAIYMARLFVDLYPEAVIPTFSLILIAVVIGTLVYKYSFRLAPVTIVGVLAMFLMVVVGLEVPVPLHVAFLTDPDTQQQVADLTADGVYSAGAQLDHLAAQSDNANALAHLERAQKNATDSCVYILLVYALLASILPVWLLLQPRDYINCFQLYAGLILLALGFLIWHPPIDVPAFGLHTKDADTAPNVLPLLFITIACGAVSGFHNLVSSGTTARQIRRETDAQVIGYGAMLTEGLLAVFVILSCVVGLSSDRFTEIYTDYSTVSKGALAAFLMGAGHVIAFPLSVVLPDSIAPQKVERFCVNLMSVMVVSFAMTTLDSGTRLLRYNIEGIGKSLRIRPIQNRYVASLIAIAAIGYFALMKINGQPAGVTLWQLFGTTNQMLAALGLLVATLLLYQLRKPVIYTLLPLGFMLVSASWAIAVKLSDFYAGYCEHHDWGNLSLLIVGGALAFMALWLVIEALRAFLRTRQHLNPL